MTRPSRLLRGTALSLAIAALGLFGCSSSPANGGDGGGGNHSDGATPTDLSLTVNDMGTASGLFSVGIGPIPIAGGQETTQCITMKMPTTTPVDVVQIETTLAPGSHHLIVYRSNATTENLTPTSCNSFQGVEMGEPPIFIAESQHSVMALPPGVAYHFPAGQMVRIEAHYINASNNPIMGQGTVLFTAGPPASYQAADIMMCGSYASLDPKFGGKGVVPGMSSLPYGFYSGGSGVDFTKLKVFAITSHEHHLGTDVKIWKSTGKTTPTSSPIFDNPSWDNPPLQSFNQNLLSFGAGEGLEWQCSYNNPGTNTVYFGTSVNDEMCFIWAYYYPSVGRFISLNDCWLN